MTKTAGIMLAVFLSAPAQAQDDERTFSVNWENDIFAGADDNYTNGVRFSIVSAENDIPHWLDETADAMPFFETQGAKRWEFAFGQNMYTPRNTDIAAPQPNDRPYAGWLYASAGLTSDTGERLDNLRLTLGVVGPPSGAEQVQEIVHDFIGSDHPQGWHHQLNTEPGVMVSYQRKWRNWWQLNPDGFGVDITPSVGGSLGNILTSASAGAVVRVGEDLPNDYGPPLIGSNVAGTDYFIPSDNFGWYVFAGLQGDAVARNIFLDGNTFSDSLSVDKKPLVGGLQLGVATTYDGVRLAYTHVFRTKEFDTQDGGDSYGAFTVSWKF